DSTTARSGALLRLLRHDHCRHESGNGAKPPFAIRLAPGEQELVGNPMPTRRRRCQPRSRKTLLDYPQLFRRRPSPAATRVNNFKATDVASVSKVIHTDNQLQAEQFGKAAYTGWIPLTASRTHGSLAARAPGLKPEPGARLLQTAVGRHFCQHASVSMLKLVSPEQPSR